MSEQQQNDKPELHVLNPRTATLAQVINLFCKLTGREPTPEEVEEARAEWERPGGRIERMGRQNLDPETARSSKTIRPSCNRIPG